MFPNTNFYIRLYNLKCMLLHIRHSSRKCKTLNMSLYSHLYTIQNTNHCTPLYTNLCSLFYNRRNSLIHKNRYSCLHTPSDKYLHNLCYMMSYNRQNKLLHSLLSNQYIHHHR